MTTYIILLRGVMPTGKNKVPMAALRAALTGAGLDNVRTYIQSGNVVAASSLEQSRLEQLVHEVIKKDIGADITVMARTLGRFRHLFRRDPFEGADTSRRYFSIMASPPSPKLLRDLLSVDAAPDQVRVAHDTIYTLYATRYSDSTFTNAYYERMLKTRITTRNYNTMAKLAVGDL